MNGRTKGMINTIADNNRCVRRECLGQRIWNNFTDFSQIAAGNDGAGFIHNANPAINGVFHLMDNALIQSVGHNNNPLCSLQYSFIGNKSDNDTAGLTAILSRKC